MAKPPKIEVAQFVIETKFRIEKLTGSSLTLDLIPSYNRITTAVVIELVVGAKSYQTAHSYR